MSDSGASYIETLEIEQRNLSSNSNGHKLSHGGPIQEYHISSRSKQNTEQILTSITIYSDVRLSQVINRDARNSIPKF